jgi:F-type H+-transporting ATPase subunit b
MTIFVLIAQAEGGGGQVETIARTFGVNWPHLTAQMISFAIVCAILYRFAYQPVLRLLEERRRQIAQGVANTEKINAALASIEAQRESALADARAQGQQLLAEVREAAKRLHEQEAQRAAVTAEQIVAKAREAATQEHARMLSELRREVGRLVVQTTTGVIGRVLTADDQRRLAEDTAQHLSGPQGR